MFYSNADSLNVASTSVTAANMASGLSAAVVEADSTEIVSSDTSALNTQGAITYTQEYPGKAVTSEIPSAQSLESTAYAQPTVNDFSQTFENV